MVRPRATGSGEKEHPRAVPPSPNPDHLGDPCSSDGPDHRRNRSGRRKRGADPPLRPGIPAPTMGSGRTDDVTTDPDDRRPQPAARGSPVVADIGPAGQPVVRFRRARWIRSRPVRSGDGPADLRDRVVAVGRRAGGQRRGRYGRGPGIAPRRTCSRPRARSRSAPRCGRTARCRARGEGCGSRRARTTGCRIAAFARSHPGQG